MEGGDCSPVEGEVEGGDCSPACESTAHCLGSPFLLKTTSDERLSELSSSYFLRDLNELDRLGGGGAFFLGRSRSVTALTPSGMRWLLRGGPLVGGASQEELLPPSSASTFSLCRASRLSNSAELCDVLGGGPLCDGATCIETDGAEFEEVCCSDWCPRDSCFISWMNFEGKRRGFCFVPPPPDTAPAVDLITELVCWRGCNGAVAVSSGGWDLTRSDPVLWRDREFSDFSLIGFLLNELVL